MPIQRLLGGAILLAASACATETISLPYDGGTYKQRQAAYRSLQITEYGTSEKTTVITTTQFLAQFPETTPAVRLANGTLVTSPAVLANLVDDSSRTAQFIDTYRRHESASNRGALIGAAGWIACGGLAGAAHLRDDPITELVPVGVLVGVVGSVVAAVIMLKNRRKRDAASASAFTYFNQDFARHLGFAAKNPPR